MVRNGHRQGGRPPRCYRWLPASSAADRTGSAPGLALLNTLGCRRAFGRQRSQQLPSIKLSGFLERWRALVGDAHELPNELYGHNRGGERQGKRHTEPDHLLRYAFHDTPPTTLSCPYLNSLGSWLTGRYQKLGDDPGAGSGMVTRWQPKLSR